MNIDCISDRPWFFSASACVLGWLFGFMVYNTVAANVQQFVVEQNNPQPICTINGIDTFQGYDTPGPVSRAAVYYDVDLAGTIQANEVSFSAYSLQVGQKDLALYHEAISPPDGGDQSALLSRIPNYVLIKTPFFEQTCPSINGKPFANIYRPALSYYL